MGIKREKTRSGDSQWTEIQLVAVEIKLKSRNKNLEFEEKLFRELCSNLLIICWQKKQRGGTSASGVLL